MKKNWLDPQIKEIRLKDTKKEHTCCNIIQQQVMSSDYSDQQDKWYCITHDLYFYNYVDLVKHLQEQKDKDHILHPIS